MLRPIDTQTIYQQSPEVSNRQQASKHGGEMQQTQLADILNKQTIDRQEMVNEINEDEKLDNDLNKEQRRQALNSPSKYKKKKKNDIHSKENKGNHTTHIDIRI